MRDAWAKGAALRLYGGRAAARSGGACACHLLLLRRRKPVFYSFSLLVREATRVNCLIVHPRGGLPQGGPLRGFFVVCGRLMMLSKMIRETCDDEATMREYLKQAEQEGSL